MKIENCVKMRLINKANLRPGEISLPWHGDIVVVYRITTAKGNEALITENNLDLLYEDGKAKLHEAAKKNVEKPMIYGYMGLTVVSNTNNFLGASVLLHPDAPKMIKERIGGNAFVIPSSIHEVLILPEDAFTAMELVNMIKEVNEAEVAPEDRLSDMVYFCDGNQFYEYTEYQDKTIKEKEEQIEFQGLVIRAVIS